jgi:hypothetical protein
MMTMRDQDQVVQELKKENFDLKLRLYMQEKSSVSNEGKVSEYEQQLGAILGKFEEQQQIFEAQARELAEAKQKEKLMLKRQRNLESECKLREEKIQNLSMSLNQLSTSMTNISSPRHYAPARNTRSMYFGNSDEEMDGEDDDDEDGVVARDSREHTPQVSRVAPMRSYDTSTPQCHGDARLNNNNNNNNNNYKHNRPGRSSFESTSSDPTCRTTTTTNNYYNINNPRQARGDVGNVGVVKPNNARTTLTTDVEVVPTTANTADTSTPPQQQQQKKKKRKGLFNVLKLCSGKSAQTRTPTREDSMYQRRPKQAAHARVTATTHQQYNTLEQGTVNEI